MTMKTIHQILKTDFVRTRWLLAGLGVVVGWFQWLRLTSMGNGEALRWAQYVVPIVSGFALAMITMNDNPARSSAHWRTRPISSANWIGAKFAYAGLVLVLPMLLLQAWLYVATGGIPSIVLPALAGTLLQASAFAAAVIGFTSLARDGRSMAVLTLSGVIAYVIATNVWNWNEVLPLVTPTRRFDALGDHRDRTPYLALTLGTIGLSTALIALVLRRHLRPSFAVVVAVLVGLLVDAGSEWQGRRTRFFSREPLFQVDKVFLNVPETESSAKTDQPIYRDLSLEGLGNSEWGNIESIDARSRGNRDELLWEQKRNTRTSEEAEAYEDWVRDGALIRMFPVGSVLLGGSSDAYGTFGRFSFSKSLASLLPKERLGHRVEIGVRGAVYRWKRWADLEIKDGVKFENQGLSVEIKGASILPNPYGEGRIGQIELELIKRLPSLGDTPPS
ncbi:MAG: hypothetical protein KDM63_11120, partial [Verrucomicrobiae bacterium]|nr:hypothetical protein [Verrucomicrobiae bacterium]